MNTEDQTLQIREARQEPQYKNRNAGPVQNATMWFVKCWAWEKNGEVETQAPPLLSHLYGFILAVLTATVGEASNGDTVHPQLSVVICA